MNGAEALCIFGGSFDPPHQGHLYVAQCAKEQLDLERTFWIPAPDPPHKAKPVTPFANRCRMVELAIEGLDGHEACAIERDLPSPSYTIHTLEAMKRLQAAPAKWFLLMGSDNLAIFATWHRWRDILSNATLAVFPRSGYPVVDAPEGTILLDLPPLDAESRRIRESLAATRDFDLSGVLPSLREYILSQGLYGMGGTGSEKRPGGNG